MKTLWLGLMLTFSLDAAALEVGGVQVDEQAQVNGASLGLNGAGVRSVMFMDMYAVALYLPSATHDAATVLNSDSPRRVALHVLMSGPISRFLNGFRKGIERNSNAQESAALQARLAEFEHLFDGIDEVGKGSIIAFDSVPGTGLHVSLDGKPLGDVAGNDFYTALLRVWLGERPVQDRLKQQLLGAR